MDTASQGMPCQEARWVLLAGTVLLRQESICSA
jgi:hypothetical protein